VAEGKNFNNIFKEIIYKNQPCLSSALSGKAGHTDNN